MAECKVNSDKRVYKAFLLGVVLGILTFVLIYGVGPLDVTSDAWIFYENGYDEWDIQQRYAGWLAFRGSDWTFPLGQANAWGYPIPNGINVAFSDSIPWVAILCKLLSPVLPQIFQYEGIYAMLVFALQGGAAAMLLSVFFEKMRLIAVSTLFFTFSPILLERAFRHTSLASHYIVLVSMYFYFRYRHDKKYPWQFLLLPIIAVGITPYFFPMVEIFILVFCLEKICSGGKRGLAVLYFVSSCFLGMAAAWVIGTVGHGYSASREGYGYYSLNLNAIINPDSCGNYTWSDILPQREQLYGQYDGFNYLGFGMLTLIGGVLLALLAALFYHRECRTIIKKLAVENVGLFFVCIFLTCFAVSNVVCFDSTQLIEIPLPEKLLKFCGIFRASSRMFYPVYYLLMLFGIVLCKDILKCVHHSKYLDLVLLVCLFLQLFDMKTVLWQKHIDMDERTQVRSSTLPSELQNIEGINFIFAADDFNTWGGRDVMCALFRCGMKTNILDCNTQPPDIDKNKNYTQKVQSELQNGILDDQMVYVTTDLQRCEAWKDKFENNGAAFFEWDVGDFFGTYYFMLPQQE